MGWKDKIPGLRQAEAAKKAAGKVAAAGKKAQAAADKAKGKLPAAKGGRAPQGGGAAAAAGAAGTQEVGGMGKKQGRTKMCPNGHVMDVSWDRCPYCPPSAAGAPPTKEVHAEAAPAAPAAAAKTEFMEVGKRSNDTPVVGWIVALNGNHKGQDFRIRDGKNRIGKGLDCDVVLTDKFLSTLHAHINYEMVGGEKKFILVDMDSTNGTYLNDAPERIHMEELIDNDKIRLGEVEFKFKCL